MKELLEKHYKEITDYIKGIDTEETFDDELIMSLYGRREEVIILYSLLLKIDYSVAESILITIMDNYSHLKGM